MLDLIILFLGPIFKVQSISAEKYLYLKKVENIVSVFLQIFYWSFRGFKNRKFNCFCPFCQNIRLFEKHENQVKHLFKKSILKQQHAMNVAKSTEIDVWGKAKGIDD